MEKVWVAVLLLYGIVHFVEHATLKKFYAQEKPFFMIVWGSLDYKKLKNI